MTRKNVRYGAPIEKEIGFSRAVKIGNVIAVTGCAPTAKDGSVHCPGDLYEQSKRSFEIIKESIEDAGGTMADVIRTRMFLTDISKWKEAAKAHGEVFSEIGPATTFVEVSGLINPEWMVEIEADAILGG